jgi:HAD superfamily hydrolase (TIGR01509 family)
VDGAAIFDLDGVLVDSGVWHRAAWQALLAELGVEASRPDWWRLTIGRPSEEALPLLLGRTLTSVEAARLARRKRDLYAGLSGQGLRAVPGAPAFVQRLERRGVARAVGTSASRRDALRMLEAVGLGSRFTVVITAEDVERGKPDPEVYTLAARRLDVASGSCVVFEDSVVGIEAARRAGMRAVGVTTAYGEEELRAAGAGTVIADFEGLRWEAIARR